MAKLMSRETVERLLTHDTIAQVSGNPDRVSEKYSPVPTLEVINRIESHGWKAIHIDIASTRVNAGYQKHLIRFARIDDVRVQNWDIAKQVSRGYGYVPEDINREFPEILLRNSHDGSTAYELSAGLFRLVCLNGLMLGTSFESYKIRHVGYTTDKVDNAISSILDATPRALDKVQEMKGKLLTDGQSESLLLDAFATRFDAETHQPFFRDLGRVRRPQDREPTLWNVFNRAQEAVLDGLIRVQNRETYDMRRAPAVRSIDERVRINRELWDIAEKYLN